MRQIQVDIAVKLIYLFCLEEIQEISNDVSVAKFPVPAAWLWEKKTLNRIRETQWELIKRNSFPAPNPENIAMHSAVRLIGHYLFM